MEIKSGWFLNSSSECAKLHSLPSLQRFELQYLQILVYFRESRICGVVITGQYCEAILSKLQSRDKRPGKGHGLFKSHHMPSWPCDLSTPFQPPDKTHTAHALLSAGSQLTVFVAASTVLYAPVVWSFADAERSPRHASKYQTQRPRMLYPFCGLCLMLA